MTTQPWPVLDYAHLKDTITTAHLWTQIVGKIRLKQMPWLNHSWHVPLYVWPRGLTTGSMPQGFGTFQIDLDCIAHELVVYTSDGRIEKMGLHSCSVAEFYRDVFEKLRLLDIQVDIYARPNEINPAIPFKEDTTQRTYDPVQMNLFWQALAKIEVVFTRFRAGFTGKVSPVHFFWGSFDLAVTRFSGRKAPKHPGGVPNIPDAVMQEAYSHEVSSCGFWPGSEAFPAPAFYSYCYPTPADFGKQPVEPKEAFYSEEMSEFFLPYEAVRLAVDPEETLLQFLRSTYEAATRTGKWDTALECDLTRFER